MIRALIFPLALLILLQLIHQATTMLGITSGKLVVLPSPSVIFSRLRELISTEPVLSAILRTIWTSVLGISLGVLGAMMVGVFVGGTRWCSQYVAPTLHFLRTLPVITYVPLALIALGSDIRTPVFLCGFVTTLYGALPIANAVAEFDREKIMFLRFRKVASLRIAFSYILPEIVAAFSTSLSVIVTLAVAICVVAEMLLPSLGGIGVWLLRTKEVSDYAGLWACTVLLGLSGFLLHAVITALWRFATPWASNSDSANNGRGA